MQPMTWKRFAGERTLALLAFALAAPAWAQTDVQPSTQTAAPAGYSCIDPMASGARRTWHAEPCRLPLVAWPLHVEMNPDEPKRTATFERDANSEQGAHELFWRLPWRGYPPHNVRSTTFWR